MLRTTEEDSHDNPRQDAQAVTIYAVQTMFKTKTCRLQPEGTYSQHVVRQIGKRTNDIDEQGDFLGHGGLIRDGINRSSGELENSDFKGQLKLADGFKSLVEDALNY